MPLAPLFYEIHSNLPREGYGRNKYTAQAFRLIPRIERPRILDIGCGPGASTLEIARLSGGEVIGIDTHQPYLDILNDEARKRRLSQRVKGQNISMTAISFPEESFDIIWSEASIYIVGFDRGLRDWRRLLKPSGCLAVHEMVWLHPSPPAEIREYLKDLYPGIRTIEENLKSIPGSLYGVMGHFPLPDDAWWAEYYTPLEKRLKKLRGKYRDNPHALHLIRDEQKEIDMYRKYSRWYGSCFFVLQKTRTAN